MLSSSHHPFKLAASREEAGRSEGGSPLWSFPWRCQTPVPETTPPEPHELKRYNPAIQNILFVCYNITLVNYVRRLLSDKHVPLGEGGVDVLHFFELCGRITGEEIPYEKADTEYYDLVIQDTLEKLPASPLKYDAILVDEGQDFSDDMLRIFMALLNPATNHLTIADLPQGLGGSKSDRNESICEN